MNIGDKMKYNIGSRFKWFGKRIVLDDIKVGEVFGAKGCFNVALRTKKGFILVDTDCDLWVPSLGKEFPTGQADSYWFSCGGQYYKLPKKTQQLYYVPEE